MRYQKTINLWGDGSTIDDIQNGKLILQTGQWVQCGNGPKSRFVVLRPGGDIWVTHHPIVEFSKIVKLWKGKR